MFVAARALAIMIVLAPATRGQQNAPVKLPDPETPLLRADGYRGVWYANQASSDEYVYKYSGGLGTYCAKHQPFAVYREDVERTYFVYGGAPADDPRKLLHLVSYYDHRTGTVPRPALLLDKQTTDAHDNPVLAVDDSGHLWVFSTSHGRARPSFIHRSVAPHRIDRFETVPATYVGRDGKRARLDNFSYMQAWHMPSVGFLCFFTRYRDPAARTSMFMWSADGVSWSRWHRLAAIDEGHYQISGLWRDSAAAKAGAASNYHPAGKGLNWRTNLYYMETPVRKPGLAPGERWTNAAGVEIEVPLTSPDNAALVHDYAADELLVYLKDLTFDEHGRPAILYVTSRGYRAGPDNAPRTWKIAHWNGQSWDRIALTTSDNNYDMGSLYIDGDDWRVVAPTTPGPQAFNPGGEMVLWASRDAGVTWESRPLTAESEHNHTYARRPVAPHPDFVALWADGHGRQPSPSRLYFADQAGTVYRLPTSFARGSEECEPETVRGSKRAP